MRLPQTRTNKNHPRGARDKISLLANTSPPPSPSPFGTSDPNICNLFPNSVHMDMGGAESFDDTMTQSVLPAATKPQTASAATNPQFERSRVPLENRFYHESPLQKEMSPTSGALQFVPAYEEATSPATGATHPMSPEDSNTSWDAIAREEAIAVSQSKRRSHSPTTEYQDMEDRGIFRRKSSANRNMNNTAAAPAATPLGVSSNSTTSNTSSFLNKRKTKQQPPEDSASAVSGASWGGNRTRIARLASLFSSRAVVSKVNDTPSTAQTTTTTTTTTLSETKKEPKKVVPSSPSRSDSSGGYVGWPGTQDKRGGTVAIQSSYEDSDIGQSLNRKKYQEELEENVDNEITIWMDDEPSFGEFSDKSSSPSSRRRIEHPQFDVKEELQGVHEQDENPADFHLAAAVAYAAAAAASPMANNQAPQYAMSSTPVSSRVEKARSNNYNAYGDGPPQELHAAHNVVSPMTDSWGANTSPESLDGESLDGISKTSSAYFNANDVARSMSSGKKNHVFGVGHNRQAAASVMRMTNRVPQPPTEETLALNDHWRPPHRTFNATNAVGFRGLLDKTKDVPNLMDDMDSDSASSRATSTHSSMALSAANIPSSYRSGLSNRAMNKLRTAQEEREEDILEQASSDIFDGVRGARVPSGDASIPESDVFDDLSAGAGSNIYSLRGAAQQKSRAHTGKREINNNHAGNSDPEEKKTESLNLVLLGGGLTTIQTTANDFSNRITASDFDDNLTHSDYDQYGFARIPGFHQMASAGKTGSSLPSLGQRSDHNLNRPSTMTSTSHAGSESGSSLFSDPYPKEEWGQNVSGDLSKYYVHPDEMKKLVRKFRKMCKIRSADLSYDDLDREEDATTAFALSEMRSRIMEKDIERGLERRGGTTAVDDIVLTPYNRAASRIRDAVIVSKAWRDGASPRDVINTSILTCRAERAYFIKRPIQRRGQRWHPGTSELSGPRYTWEEVAWVDDTDFTQYRCTSLSPRHMRGFEMFTIGDCQSILLKLSNERCLVGIFQGPNIAVHLPPSSFSHVSCLC
jgi:hypothetical protein